MKSASQNFRPQLLALENRVQPGSVLFRGGLDTSLLAGTIIPLDLQDQAQDQRAPALATPQSVTNAPETSQVALVPPLVGGTALGNPIQTIQATHAATMDPQMLMIDHAQVAHPLSVSQNNGTPIGNVDSGKAHTEGGACELPGNVVVDGDFETIPHPPVWFQIGDPFAAYVSGGGDLTPGNHLIVGAVGTPGMVFQDLNTDPTATYTVTFSIHLDTGVPVFMMPQWGGKSLDDLSTLPPSTTYTRVQYTQFPDGSPIQGTVTDRFQFLEQQDPAYWHIDDVCITPN